MLWAFFSDHRMIFSTWWYFLARRIFFSVEIFSWVVFPKFGWTCGMCVSWPLGLSNYQPNGVFTLLQTINLMACSHCGGKHRRYPVSDVTLSEARYCARCNTRHAVKEASVTTLPSELVCFVFPLMPTFAIWVHPVPDRVKPSFVIFDIRAL